MKDQEEGGSLCTRCAIGTNLKIGSTADCFDIIVCVILGREEVEEGAVILCLDRVAERTMVVVARHVRSRAN